jgi:hypothetical protein
MAAWEEEQGLPLTMVVLAVVAPVGVRGVEVEGVATRAVTAVAVLGVEGA